MGLLGNGATVWDMTYLDPFAHLNDQFRAISIALMSKCTLPSYIRPKEPVLHVHLVRSFNIVCGIATFPACTLSSSAFSV